MDLIISELKKDFYLKIHSLSTPVRPQITPSIKLLTSEELKELENAWIELVVWKSNHTH